MMYWTRDRTAAMLPILTAFAEGKTVECGSDGGGWTAPEEFAFSSEWSHYRVRPESEVIVAGEDLPALWAEIKNGVAVKHTPHKELTSAWLYVPNPISKGERVEVIKSNHRDFRDTLVRVKDPVVKPYEPRVDGELSWAWMREKGQEFADNDQLIPMVRDLGHWLVLAINKLEAERAQNADPAEPVSVANQDEFDDVNHPKHYTSDPSNYECIQFAEHMTMCLGNATKYLWREGLKGDAIEQLQKAVWYLRDHLKIDPSSAATLNIHKVINGRAWPIAEAMRLVWKVSQRRSPNERGDILEAIEILEAEIDRRKEAAK